MKPGIHRMGRAVPGIAMRVSAFAILAACSLGHVGCTGEDEALAPPAVVVESTAADNSGTQTESVTRIFLDSDSPADHIKVGRDYRWLIHRFFDSGVQDVQVDDDQTFPLNAIVDESDLDPSAIGLVVVGNSPYGFVEHWVALQGEGDRQNLGDKRISLLPFEDAPLVPEKADNEPQVRAFEVVSTPWEFVSEVVAIPRHARLRFSYAVQGRGDSLAQLRIYAQESDESRTLLWETTAGATDYNWHDASVELDSWAGESVRFVFRSDSEESINENGDSWTQPVWGSPLVLSESPEPSVERPPNIILISIDTLRADHLGCYGYALPTSPNLDAFSESALLFEEAFAPSSWTLPAHAAMMSGLHPTQQPRSDDLFYVLPDEVDMIAEAAAEAGYLTTAFTEGVLVAGDIGFAQGFDRYYDGPGYRQAPAGSSTDTFSRSSDWLELNRDLPIFLFVHTYEVHVPYEPVEPYKSQFAPDSDDDIPAIARYDAEIAHTDFELGKFIEAIDAMGLAENTIVIVASDHGEEFGDHGDTLHMKTVFRESLHVPLLIRMPDGTAGRVRRPVSITDLYATLLDMMEISDIPRYESHTLMPFLAPDSSDETYTRELVPSNVRNLRERIVAVGAQADQWKYIARGEIPPRDAMEALDVPLSRVEMHLLRSLETRGATALLDVDELLFDVRADPYEQNDVIATHPDQGAVERQRILDYLVQLDRETPFSAQSGQGKPLTESDREEMEALGYL